MRNINAEELLALAEFYRKNGYERKAKNYEEEERKLQNEMNQD